MSVIGLLEVVRLINESNLVEGLGGRDLTNPEGCGIDMRLGKAHKIIEGGAYIEADGTAGLGRRKGVKTEEVAHYVEGGEIQESLIIKPGEYYLVQTIESVITPLNVMPVIFPRSSLFRAGLQLLSNKADPGYSGTFTFGLANLSQFEVSLQMGARICNTVFFKIDGDSIVYRGQHQGGRVSPEKEERQV